MKRWSRVLPFTLVALFASAAFAQPMAPPGPSGPPALGRGHFQGKPEGMHGGRGFEWEIRQHLVAPEALMRFQSDIGLSEAQRSALIAEMQKGHAQLVQIEWQLAEAARQLAKLVEAPKVDEGKALAQADKVMQLERDLKRGRLGMMIRMKNQLTEEQQRKLRELQEQMGPHGRRGERRMERLEQPAGR